MANNTFIFQNNSKNVVEKSNETTIPRALLKEFLQETGIRFLDNLSSMARRETTGRPRESESTSETKQLFVDIGLSIEGDALDDASVQLSSMINSLKEDLLKREEQFNHSPPLAYIEYHGHQVNDRAQIINKLKTLKSVSRLLTKQAWYVWRQKVHSDLNYKLESNYHLLQGQTESLVALADQFDMQTIAFEPLVNKVTEDVQSLCERVRLIQSGEYEQSVQLEHLLTEQSKKIEIVDQEMNLLVKKEQELRAAIESIIQERQALQQKVASMREEIDAIPSSSLDILDEVKSNFALMQGVVGWRVVNISADRVCLAYPRCDNLNVIFKFEQSKVISVSFDSVSLDSLSSSPPVPFFHIDLFIYLEITNFQSYFSNL